jgi:hypothetical protein
MSTETELVHARHDLHLLRARTLKCLIDNFANLNIGLSAVQGDYPKPHVLQDRVERVLTSMLKEIETLRSDNQT